MKYMRRTGTWKRAESKRRTVTDGLSHVNVTDEPSNRMMLIDAQEAARSSLMGD